MKILVATLGHTADDDRVYHKQIRSLLRGGHQVTLATRNQPVINTGPPGFQHVDFGAVGVVQFGAALQSLAEQWQPQALQIHEFELLAVGGRIKKKLAIPVIYDVQDANIEMWATFSSKPAVLKHIIKWGLLRFEKMHLRHVDRVSAHSAFIARRYAGWGVASVSIPNYPRLISLDLDVQREPVVIYEGQLSHERGIGHLIEAFASVVEIMPNVKLEIYGPERVAGHADRMRAMISGAGLDASITIWPPIPYVDILKRLTQVQVGVIPFLDRPIFRVAPPNKLYEYMLCGCTVVASDLPILRELGKDCVLYVTPGNAEALATAIVTLLTDADRRKTLAVMGRKLVESTYHWEQVEPDYLRIYEELA
ncbi:MAG: glycosyltransferase family 4 protein [Candidatus Marinimicrobia bacterium]|nr:glycosyltransferase family 4 protein [Candidatus Neomarinimicrobiota bacterium]